MTMDQRTSWPWRVAACRVVLGLVVLLAAGALGAHAHHIDRGTRTVRLHIVGLGQLPAAVVLDGGVARAVVADEATATVSVLDLTTLRVFRTAVVGQPGTLLPLTLALDGRRHRVVAVNPGPGDGRTPSVVRLLDSRTGAVRATVHLTGQATAAAVDERVGHVLVATQGAGGSHVVLLDARTGALLRTTPVGLAPQALSVDPSTARAFVVGAALMPAPQGVGSPVGLVGVVDTRTGALLRTVSVGAVGDGAGAVAVDVRQARIFVATSSADTVSVLDARIGVLLRTVRVGGMPTTLAVDERRGRVVVVNAGDGTVRTLDASTGRLLWTRLDGGVSSPPWRGAVPTPDALAVDAVRARVYVTRWGPLDRVGRPLGNGRLAILDARTGRLLQTLAVGIAPLAVAVEAGSGRVVVVNGGGVMRVSQGWLEQGAQQMSGWVPWLVPQESHAVAVPGSIDVIDPRV